MKPVSLVLALFLVESFGFPQVPPTSQDAPAVPDPSTTLVSPWSQWTSLKAPPISLAKPKKKLLPGPPPPEGTPEAPWVTWTRMKVSTALAPPVPPPPPPPSPVGSGESATNDSTAAPEQSVWIQWTQMKLPLASPLAPASPAQETPWDAWTNLKSPIAQIPATVGTGPTVSKRMAPDRYSIASTVAPGVITWPPQQNGEGEGYSQNLPQPQLRLPSTSPEYTNMGVRGSIQSVPSSYLDVVRPSTGQSFTPVSKAGELPANLAALVESTPELARLPPSVRNQVLEELGLLSQVSPGPTTTPSPAQRVPSASVQTTTMPDISSVLSTLPPPVLQQLMATTTPAEAQKLIEAISTASKEKTPSSTPPAAASAVLSMIPEPVRLQILGKATSAELAQIIGVLSKLEQKIPDENPLVSSIEVETILPLSLVQKLPPAVAPLLTKKLDIPPVPPTILLSKSIPEPILSTILGVANPLEIVELTENLEKVEALAPVPTPPIAALLPPTLTAKLPPTLVPVLSKLTPEKVPVATQVPPTVSAEIAAVLAAIPAPLLKEILTEATLEELTEVVENVAKLEKLTPVPKLPVMTLLPPTLLSKLSPALVPLLTKVVVLTPPSTTTTEAPAEVLTVLANIPEQLLTEMLTVATPDELAQIAETISSIEGPAPEKKPISDLLPPSLIPKLSAEVASLVGGPVVIPAKLVSPKPEVIPINAISAILSIIPEPILPAVLAKATPEELSELVDLVVKLDAMPPEAKPLISKLEVATILPASLLAKIPPSLTPLLEKNIDIAPKVPKAGPLLAPPVPAATASVLSILPPAIIPSIIATATPEELAELVERVEKLEAIPEEEKALIPTVKIADILPPSILSKLPPSVAPLLAKEIDVADLTGLTAPPPPVNVVPPAPPTAPLVPAATATVLSILPPAIIPSIIATATPKELTELVERVENLAAIPEEEKALIPTVKIADILPPSILSKLPPSVAPLLAKEIDVADLTGLTAPPPPVNVVPPAPPTAPLVPAATATVLSILPPAIIPSIIATATPKELTELVERVENLAAIPEEEKALIPTVKVADILPPSILPNLPSTITPLLSTEIDTAVLTDLVSPPKILLPEAPLIPLATAVVLSVLPPPLIAPIIDKATSEELIELVERVEKLKAIPEEEKALIPSVQVAAILPPSLIEKLPAEVTPLLKKGVAISELPLTIPEVPAAAAPSVPTIVVPPTPAIIAPPSLATVLSVLPPPVVPEILAKATPEELTELAATIAKLESIPAEQKPLLLKIEVAAILPPSLLAKLSPEALPLLEKEVVLPPPAPEKVPPGVTAPTKVVPTLPPSVLQLLPEAVVPVILAKATPEELTELINTVESLEAIPPEALPKLVVGNILPPTLIPKLSPAVLPLLSTEVVIPPTEPIPAATPVTPEPEDIIPPELKSIPEPLLSTILAVATPTELKEIVETVKELEAVPPEQKPLLPKLPILSVLPATLLSKLPPAVAPLLTLELVVPTEAVGIPVELPVLQAVPEPVLSEILAVASPLEVEQLVETLTELEKLTPEQKALLPKPLTIMDVLPPALLSKLPSEIVPLLSKEVIPEAAAPPETVLPEPATPAPVEPSSTEAPPTKAEEKLLTKWAKIILEKTGKPVAPVPGEIPPLQAAWMEWIQLQVNETKKAEAATTTSKPPVLSAPSGEEVTTEYPWTKWLKLKSSTPPVPINPATLVPALDVGTESPEKATLEWLEALEKATEQPASTPPPEITPEMEEKVVELLKQLGIENVQLPPEQIPALVAALAAGAVPPVVPPTASKVITLPPSDSVPPPPFVPLLPPSVAPPAPVLRPFPPSAYPAYLPPPPFYPLAPRPFWVPSSFNPYMAPPVSPLVPAEPTLPPTTEQATGAPPTINLTQYLIANKLIPAAALPSAPIPITAVAKMLEAQPEPTEESTSASNEVAVSTPRTITSSELAALTPTKFASLLKQILKDCNNSNILVTRSAHSKGKGSSGAGGGFDWMAMKNKFKPAFAGPPAGVTRGRRALLPIPSQGVGAPPPQLDQGSSNDLLPLPSLSMPKVETAGTVLDPAYWAAQKSMFLSKLFSTLAKVALNDSAQQQTTTLSPKEQLAKQVNTVLLNSMTRSVKQHQKETEEEEEYESSDEDQQNVDENELVTNDNSEPNLPKEPENPLHKLFKFGVQKTVLSDLSTPAPDPQPIYIYVTSPPPPLEITTTPSLAQQREMINKLKKVYDENKKLKQKVKGKKRKYKTASTSKTTGGGRVSGSSNSHHHTKNHSFRKPTTSPATTESPVDFELLAKALLVDNKAKK